MFDRSKVTEVYFKKPIMIKESKNRFLNVYIQSAGLEYVLKHTEKSYIVFPRKLKLKIII